MEYQVYRYILDAPQGYATAKELNNVFGSKTYKEKNYLIEKNLIKREGHKNSSNLRYYPDYPKRKQGLSRQIPTFAFLGVGLVKISSYFIALRMGGELIFE